MFNPQQFEDGVLDAVLMSMGRTMTREDVCQLMQRTVQQVRPPRRDLAGLAG